MSGRSTVYCMLFRDKDRIHSDITNSFDRVKEAYEKHKKAKELHQFDVIKHTEIDGTTEYDYHPLDFKTIDPQFDPKWQDPPPKRRDTFWHDLAVATHQ